MIWCILHTRLYADYGHKSYESVKIIRLLVLMNYFHESERKIVAKLSFSELLHLFNHFSLKSLTIAKIGNTFMKAYKHS